MDFREEYPLHGVKVFEFPNLFGDPNSVEFLFHGAKDKKREGMTPPHFFSCSIRYRVKGRE
jgi:hypothetical protein